MGQKYSEVPSVDYWVQLTRSADRAGAGHTLPIREVDTSTEFGRWEMDRFALMQRYRNRFIARLEQLNGEPRIPQRVDPYQCVRCGRTIADPDARTVSRQSWDKYGNRTDLYRHVNAADCA